MPAIAVAAGAWPVDRDAGALAAASIISFAVDRDRLAMDRPVIQISRLIAGASAD